MEKNPTKINDSVLKAGRRYRPYWIILLLVGAGLFVTAIYYFMAHSEPAQLSLQILRQSSEVKEAIGEIQDLGWPRGTITSHGTANFNVSVRGSLAKGRFYASFLKHDATWIYRAGRLRLEDGRSIEVPPPAASPSP